MHMSNDTSIKRRILFLTTIRSYRLEAFRVAAEKLGVEVTTGLDLPEALTEQWPDALPLNFADIGEAARKIAEYAQHNPLSAILSVDDSGSLVAAAASNLLGLPHNDPAAAVAARDKAVMRRMLGAGGVAVPWFREYTTADDPAVVSAEAPYPCVVKPVNLNGSRGVMRADSPSRLISAIERLTRLITTDNPDPRPYLVEEYLPGVEVALEGMLNRGALTVLALFDKPDPLEGPFFEETIYVTPSRLPVGTQTAIEATTTAAARALGLVSGPIHAELRINEGGVWIIEIAGRSIGGLCSQVLRFGVDASLEELIVRQAAGLSLGDTTRSDRAAGVMMIPIPEAGLLREIIGVDEAAAIPLIESVEITARLNYPLVPLPEGDSYLGFIFARGETPEAVESALRQAHERLKFRIDALLPIFSLQ
ncbi:MAG TPA: ATP-grasp domain-containing protein [Promineifilum sp.]|nr:ATP-grasp domain-containing protein [Promineifilum sp.]HRO22834.1 ATP-grasp domain-containing protein [Promineifilum sp.]HRO91228.1 ATP-grasp domain-containing protein [Promineifilum sp.]